MRLPVMPPVKPMLAKAVYEVPRAEDLLYEPKWDGFRCVVFRDGDEIELGSRTDRPLSRYFPEMLPALQAAASRVNKRAGEIPASFVAFDLLALGDRDVTGEPFAERRRLLEGILAAEHGDGRAGARVYLTPVTDDADEAEDWFRRFEGAGFDGVMAKR